MSLLTPSRPVVEVWRVALGEDGGEDLCQGEEVEAVVVEGVGEWGGIAFGDEAVKARQAHHIVKFDHIDGVLVGTVA